MCKVPVDDELCDDFELPNFRKPLPNEDRANVDLASDDTNFRPAIISPRYIDTSSNGSFYGNDRNKFGIKGISLGDMILKWRLSLSYAVPVLQVDTIVAGDRRTFDHLN